MALSDEEIDAIEAGLGYPSPVQFARAILAAEDAKRPKNPHEWVDESMSLADEYAAKATIFWNNQSAQAAAKVDAQSEALRNHISTPPSGYVFVPEKCTEKIGVAIADAIDRDATMAEIYDDLIAAAKEAK